MKKIRHIKLLEERGAMQMAIDESILNSACKGQGGNTIRFYTWKPRAISIGFFQSLSQEINTKKAKEESVDIIRRYTGGGAVFHDSELTYSLVISERDVPSGVAESYEYICRGLVKGLFQLGLVATFSPINDILVSGKKISGNAQTRKNGFVLQHGTILIDVDVERMFSLLLVPDEKLKDKLISDVKQRVTSLKGELEKDLDLLYLEEVFLKSFSESLGFVSERTDLDESEMLAAKKLCQEKYENDIWNNQR